MNPERAKELLLAERARISDLLGAAGTARAEDNDAERDAGDGDTDGAQPLEHEALDIAIATSLTERLAAVQRAEERLADGSYGLSVESGLPIPDDRLEADPAAELTVDEAAKHKHRHQKQPRGETGF